MVGVTARWSLGCGDGGAASFAVGAGAAEVLKLGHDLLKLSLPIVTVSTAFLLIAREVDETKEEDGLMKAQGAEDVEPSCSQKESIKTYIHTSPLPLLPLSHQK